MKTKRFNFKRFWGLAVFCLALGLLLCPAFAPSQALAGNIIIDGTSGGGTGTVASVYGNGAPPDGTPLGVFPDTANNNSVTVTSGGTVTDTAYGGYAQSGSGTATATHNTVTISGGTVNGVVNGGRAYISSTGTTTATGNTVTISGGSVGGDVHGGRALAWAAGSATANSNTVTISGGSVNNSVYGGLAGTGAPGSATAKDNTVTISGSPTFGAATILYGGWTTGAGVGDAFTGNTLNVRNYSGSAVDGVRNFQYLNFLFPTSQTTPVLDVTTGAVLGGGPGKLSTITASTLGGAPLQAGANVTLIDGPVSGGYQTKATGMHGAALLYNWTLTDAGGTGLFAALNSVQANPQFKALSEGKLASLAFANQGADLILGQGMFNLLAASRKAGGSGFTPFFAINGGTSEYDTGSHIDVDGFSVLLGLGWNIPLESRAFTWGVFFEAGWGGYDSYNSFNNLPTVKGKGDTTYYGTGLLGRFETQGGFYAEGSVRGGRTDSDFRSSDIMSAGGGTTRYDSDSAYFGAHAGVGNIVKITEKGSLDLSVKYIWTHQTSDTVNISSGDAVKFESVDSYRVRLGGRFAYAVTDIVKPYAGAYYEREFGGKAKAKTYGFAIDEPELSSGTGIGELGLSLTLSKIIGLSIDLGVQGYMGEREGVTGALRMKYEF
jgi:hypothetical protein